MIIKSLELKNYRNYKELYLDLKSGTSLLYGDNAQGKTNIRKLLILKKKKHILKYISKNMRLIIV